MTTYTGTLVTVELVGECCSECGTHYGLPHELYSTARQTGTTFWCPRGHRQHYTVSENQSLKDQLAREKHVREQAEAYLAEVRDQRDAATRRVSAQRGLVTRIKNRVGHGVCPCCNRAFVNLGRHMQGQHPTWMPEDDA